MANEYAVNQADLKTVADAIRAKAGLSDGLAFPDGFAEAIAAIASGGAASGLAYDMGEFSVEADKAVTGAANAIKILHNLGDAPDFVCVWTDHWAGATEAPYSSGSTMVGWVWLREISGLIGRASNTANLLNPMIFTMSINGGDYRMTGGIPGSVAYGIVSGLVPDAQNIYTPALGANTWWRGGVTYKYFASKAWWIVGGGANA